jgi:hypothetical protein
MTSDDAGSMYDPDAFAHAQRHSIEASSKHINSGQRKSHEMMDFEDRHEAETNKTKNSILSKKNKRRMKRREQHHVVMDLFLALILCHNVTPVYAFDTT